MMWVPAELIPTTLSLAAAVISVVYTIIEKKHLSKKFRDIDISARELVKIRDQYLDKIENLSSTKIYLAELEQLLFELYPYSHCRIRIRAIKSCADESKDCDVITYIDNTRDVDPETELVERISDNTGLSSVFFSNKRFFFVSGLEQYKKMFDYTGAPEEAEYNWSTTITYPIRSKTAGMSEEIIGFLCIDSEETFDNVKKNKTLMSFLEKSAKALYAAVSQFL